MKTALTREEVREVDRRAIEEFGVPGVVLMENAGRGAAELLISLGIRGPVVICCGKGNNGGDGFVIARHLDLYQYEVRVLLFAEPAELRGDAKINFDIIARSRIPLRVFATVPQVEEIAREFAAADWIVDALFGTGLTGPVRPPFDEIITAINESGTRVLAVDIPSGLDCDTGSPLGPTIKANHTATFVALKTGFLQSTARAWIGQVHVVDIGVPRLLYDRNIR
jgi:NAD(P)H-hydrate epimerase